MPEEREISQEQFDYLQNRYDQLLIAAADLCRGIADWQLYKSSPSYYTSMNNKKRKLEQIVKKALDKKTSNQPELNI